ncbi:MAG TPA: histidine--tRNA ligase [Thermodesulfovibrionales bacterium]|nr:histidine--tRNA ligase [Thermodesulfovibrionales bacterium]
MKFSALKGVHDILPPDVYLWQRAESLAREICSIYGFQEVRVPLIESTDIFTRSIGATTDIVEKEMYTFPDRAGRSITLRPEGTASVVRAYIENHLHTLPSPQKFFYSGPMFRYERPQKGRFRQFHQIGAEAFGVGVPELDAEVLSMLRVFLEKLGLRGLNFEVNSIGCDDCRPAFRKALLDFFSPFLNDLCPDCQRRYASNPLRILDCKVERCIQLRSGAPRVTDFLCGACRDHFETLLSLLDVLHIPHTLNPVLVRGLDYYTRTTFEVTSEHLGSQKAVAAGGRYDKLVEEFGGPKTPAIGFAIGIERLITLMKERGEPSPPSPDVFIATLGRRAVIKSAVLAEELRARGFWAEVGYDGSSLKSQLRKADRLSSRYAVIIGEDELSSGKLTWKNLRDGTQGEIDGNDMAEFLSSLSRHPQS